MASWAERLASLPEHERRVLLDGLSEQDARALLFDWQLWARPEQLTPDGDWTVWLILSGRGWGKTRTGAEDVKAYGLRHPKSRIAVVAPTYADARDTCVEGDSGLLRVLPPNTVDLWNRSLGELLLANGTRYKLFSADQPERLRGPQHHRAWCDELGAWRYPDAWDMLMFGLRLGMHPQAVVTTTPRPSRLIKELSERKDVHLTHGNTFENAAHLAPSALETLKRRYLQTRIGRQELFAEILDDNPAALWKRAQLDALRVTKAPDCSRIVVAVDPPAASGDEEGQAACGIVVCGLGEDGHGYVLEDCSLRGSPNEWGQAVVTAYHKYVADLVVGEVNQGGDMVRYVVQTAAQGYAIPFKAVRATRGKYLRAEPVAALDEQGRVHHVGFFPLLEDQLVEWTPGDTSPDRLDARVWGITELMLDDGDDEAMPGLPPIFLGGRRKGS